jgi:UDP-2,3-diacylglucosamine pyrophosphatase LpxH
MHIGGDETLREVDFMDELLDFLRDLEESDEDAELIVNGDAFGLWEFTEIEGLAKFDALVENYPELFEQLRRTGERIAITFMPGNHDYELACYPEYVERLAEYNVTLEQEVVLTREVAGRVVWIEHGQQRDPNNKSPDFGNPYANPPGYHVNQHITSRAGKLSKRGKFNWLKDIQSVTPMTQIPDWMVSKYYYREMSPLLRYVAVPFLLLFNVSVFYLVIASLDIFGIWSLPHETAATVLERLSVIGLLVDVVLFVNAVVFVLLVLLAVPAFFLVRDVRRTLERFGLIGGDDPEEVEDVYTEAARELFREHPEVAVYIYGHTHRASVTEVDDRLVVNTGTWLKRLQRRSVVLGLLPRVFYPSYRLNYVRIFEEDGSVVVEYEVIEKSNPKELTLLERVLTSTPPATPSIPDRSVVGGSVPTASSPGTPTRIDRSSGAESVDD